MSCSKSEVKATSAALRRIGGVLAHVSPSPCAGGASTSASQPASDKAQIPPVVAVDREGLPPQPWLKEQSDRLGGLFTVRTPSGKERVVLTDPSLFQSLFYPDEVHLSRLFGMRQFNERGFKWRGGGIADPNVLNVIRKALLPKHAEGYVDHIGRELKKNFDTWGDSGEKDLFDIAHATMHPVSEKLFGQRFSASECPALRKNLVEFDAEVGKAIYQEPLDDPEAHVTARKNMEQMLRDALEAGVNTTGDAPLLTATFGPKKVPAKWGKFGTSNVWAAQGNTIPATFWTMAYVMASPGNWLRRCQEECRAVFAGLPDAPKHPAWKGSWADASNLEKMIPITSACFMEALRLKGTGAEFRVVLKDHVVTSGGKEYFLREGQELYNSSYFMHHSDKVYDDPEQFRPERWLEEEAGEGSFSTGGKKFVLSRKYLRSLPEFSYIPFGAGLHVCAGRYLAKAEILIFVALLFRDFDVELTSELPGTLWRNAIGVVRPDRPLRFRYKRRK